MYLVHAQWCTGGDEGIEADVELEAVQQQWPVDVHLSHLYRGGTARREQKERSESEQ